MTNSLTYRGLLWDQDGLWFDRLLPTFYSLERIWCGIIVNLMVEPSEMEIKCRLINSLYYVMSMVSHTLEGLLMYDWLITWPFAYGHFLHLTRKYIFDWCTFEAWHKHGVVYTSPRDVLFSIPEYTYTHTHTHTHTQVPPKINHLYRIQKLNHNHQFVDKQLSNWDMQPKRNKKPSLATNRPLFKRTFTKN